MSCLHSAHSLITHHGPGTVLGSGNFTMNKTRQKSLFSWIVHSSVYEMINEIKIKQKSAVKSQMDRNRGQGRLLWESVFEWRQEESKGTTHESIWRKTILCWGSGKCKGPQAGTIIRPPCLRGSIRILALVSAWEGRPLEGFWIEQLHNLIYTFKGSL